MFIPRSNGEDCQPSSSLSCSSSDGQPIQSNSHDTSYGGPGPSRYIGVVMVAGLVVLALVLWLWLGAWPRKMVAKGWRGRRKGQKKYADETCGNGVIDLTASLPSLEKPKRVRIRGDDVSEPTEPTGGLAASKRAEESEP